MEVTQGKSLGTSGRSLEASGKSLQASGRTLLTRGLMLSKGIFWCHWGHREILGGHVRVIWCVREAIKNISKVILRLRELTWHLSLISSGLRQVTLGFREILNYSLREFSVPVYLQCITRRVLATVKLISRCVLASL